jgi:hypothetical protein
MSKVRITLEMPSAEEFEETVDSMTEEEYEDHFNALDSVETMEELFAVLEQVGINIIEE